MPPSGPSPGGGSRTTDGTAVKRLAIVLVLVSGLSGCSSDDSGTPDAALPVVAPMQAHERLVHDVGIQNDRARQRRQAIEDIHRDRGQ